MSTGSYSANQANEDKDQYGNSGGYGSPYSSSGSYNEGQPSQDGMTTQPSVGRFTKKERVNTMFSRKPATPVMPPANNSMLLSQDSSSQSSSGGIVNLRDAPRGEGKMKKNVAKGKK